MNEWKYRQKNIDKFKIFSDWNGSNVNASMITFGVKPIYSLLYIWLRNFFNLMPCSYNFACTLFQKSTWRNSGSCRTHRSVLHITIWYARRCSVWNQSKKERVGSNLENSNWTCENGDSLLLLWAVSTAQYPPDFNGSHFDLTLLSEDFQCTGNNSNLVSSTSGLDGLEVGRDNWVCTLFIYSLSTA
jgi:hypothetical protein